MSGDRRTIRVAVVGGGVAGLSAAFRLREEMQAAQLAHEIVLYEEKDTCGGATRTDQFAGFSLDHGPNGWLSSESLTARLVDALGLGGELIRADAAARHRFVFTRNRLHRLPESPGQFLASRLLRPWEKIRVLGEFLTPGRGDDEDETIYDFGCRRLGRGFTESLLDPMVSGVVAGDIHRLSLPAVFPKMRSMELEYGGLCKALLAKKRVRNPVPGARESGGPAGPTGVLTTLRGGTGRLSDALVQAMATSIQRNRPVRALTRQDHRLTVWCDGSKECFDAVVVAVPAHQAAGMIEGLAPRAARSLEQIEFANVVVVCHMYDADTLGIKLDGFGHLIPRRDGIRALGCLWTSCIFPGQALDGKVLLRTIFGGTHDPTVVDLPDEQLVRLVVESTAATLGISTKPHLTRIYRHRQGIPQYTLGHRQRVAEVDRLGDEMPNLAFVGASYRGASLNRCIRDAYTIAPRVLEPFGVRLAPVPVS